MLRLLVQNEQKEGVQADIQITSGNRSLAGRTDENGLAYMKTLADDAVFSVLIEPFDGHWSYFFRDLKGSSKVTCQSIQGALPTSWWKDICGLNSASPVNKRLRVGVIDQAFSAECAAEGIICIDIDGKPVSRDVTKHGYHVASLINECSGNHIDGDIVLVDVTDRLAPAYWNFNQIAAAVELLVEDFQVDVINISGGSYPKYPDEHSDSVELLRQKIAWANSKGVLVVAAVGNSKSKGVGFPAKFDEVVGVGALGRVGLAPQWSMAGQAEVIAIAEKDANALGEFDDSTPVFHVIHTSFGDGLDVVTPGVGVVHKFSNEETSDLMGTSFAAPIATSIFVKKLGSKDSYWDLFTEGKAPYVKRALPTWSVDLNIEASRQGYGLLTMR